MSDYTQVTDFGPKDALTTGNPAKKIKGTEIDVELDAIATAIGTKFDSSDVASLAEAAAGASNSVILTPQRQQYALENAVLGGTGNTPANGSASEVGYRGIPPKDPGTGNYTALLSDAGKHLTHESGDGSGDTYTIPANASVAFPIGTTLTFVNLDSNSLTIAITSDTLTLAGTTSTGSRTLAQNSYAVALKVTSTGWLISGPGLA